MTENSPAPPPPRPSNYKPILLTLLFSLLLAGGSCFGFLNTFNLNRNSQISMIFAAGFAFNVLTFLGSLLWIVIKAIRDSINISRGPK
jgi:hypothetical protein